MDQKEIDLEVEKLFNRDQYATITILDEISLMLKWSLKIQKPCIISNTRINRQYIQ